MKINMHFMLAVTLTSILKMAKHTPNGKEVQPLAAENVKSQLSLCVPFSAKISF